MPESSKAPVLSVVVPCYNERATVAELLRRVKEVPVEKEIIVIDDKSTDGSKDVVAALAQQWPEIRHLLQTVNQGKGAAIRRAAELAGRAGEDASVYVVHLSSEAGLAAVRGSREAGLPVLAETCPQYLFLTGDSLDGPDEEAASFVCAPPLRANADRAA